MAPIVEWLKVKKAEHEKLGMDEEVVYRRRFLRMLMTFVQFSGDQFLIFLEMPAEFIGFEFSDI